MFTVLGYIGAVVVLASYWISVRKSNPTVFHWGNVIGSLLMIGGVVVAGVWYSAAVTATFGMIGAYGLVATYMKREKVSPAVKLLSAPARDLGSAEAFVPEEATHMLTDEMRFALRGQAHVPKGPTYVQRKGTRCGYSHWPEEDRKALISDVARATKQAVLYAPR